jgi:DNA-directed RNA polymerase sigma subunit (sigma70/sigma32)
LWVESQLNPEEECLREEELEMARERVAEFVTDFNDREQDILFNHILDDEPSPLEEFAKRYDTSKTSIFRDKARILKKLRLAKETV